MINDMIEFMITSIIKTIGFSVIAVFLLAGVWFINEAWLMQPDTSIHQLYQNGVYIKGLICIVIAVLIWK